jgi:hypothetical protein
MRQGLSSKIFFIMVLFLVFNIGLYTGDFGIKVGLTSTELEYSDEYEEADSLTGFQVGMFYDWELYRGFSIQVEGYYIRKGNKVVDAIKFRIDYLEVPLLMKFDIAMGSRIKAGLFAGGYGAYRLSARLVDVPGGDQSSDIKKVDYGMILGVSICCKLRTLDLIMDARYSQGLENIIRWPSIGESIKNRGFAILFGIGF